ncbi:MAG: GGDEF domain-containing protein [Candidatus Cloacimonadales bacterium]
MNLLPILPYILGLMLLIIALRQNNRQLLFISLLSLFSYYILRQLDFAEISSLQIDSFALNLLLLIVPLNLLFISSRKKPINTFWGYLLAALLLLQMLVFYFLAKFPRHLRTEAYFNFRTEFPRLALGVQNLAADILSWLTPDKQIMAEGLPFLVILVALFTLLFTLLKFLKNPDHLLIAACFQIIYLLTAIYFLPNSSMLLYSFYAITLFILIIEANLSLAYIDELTNLPTRRKMNETMQTLGSNYAIAMIDVDKFKTINDKYGHKTGDQALQFIAAKLAAIKGSAKVFRFAGDEFTAIFPGKSSAEALPFLEDFRDAVVNGEFVIRGKDRKTGSAKDRNQQKKANTAKPKISVSVGIAAKDKNFNTPQKVLKQADKKLYKSKKSGRNKVTT